MNEWISIREAAALLEVSESTVYRSLADPAAADREWGVGNWRQKPLSRRGDFQVRRARAQQLAAGQPESGAAGPASDADQPPAAT